MMFLQPSPPAASYAETTPIERIRVGDRATIFRTPASPCWYIQFNLEGKQYRLSLKTHSKKRALELAKKKDAPVGPGPGRTAVHASRYHRDAKERYLQTLAARGPQPEKLPRSMQQTRRVCGLL